MSRSMDWHIGYAEPLFDEYVISEDENTGRVSVVGQRNIYHPQNKSAKLARGNKRKRIHKARSGHASIGAR